MHEQEELRLHKSSLPVANQPCSCMNLYIKRVRTLEKKEKIKYTCIEYMIDKKVVWIIAT